MFKIGDIVFVPNAYDVEWKPWLTYIKEIRNEKYICEVKHQNYSSFNASPSVVECEFDQVFDNPLDCKQYIDDYYYDGMCKKCDYHKVAGTILTCSMCKHNIKSQKTRPTDWDVGYCNFTGVKVWTQEKSCSGAEICKNFSPILPQYKDWTWERYADLLRNCEFNPRCRHHKLSCHKTCTYEKYMDEFVKIPVSLRYGKRIVDYVLVKRSEWADQSYKSGDKILAWGVGYAPEYTKNGKLKKGTVNQVEMFGEVKAV